jgi:hypothetical protein
MAGRYPGAGGVNFSTAGHVVLREVTADGCARRRSVGQVRPHRVKQPADERLDDDHPHEDPVLRSRDGRMLAGVYAGFARYLGLDVTLARVI